MYVREMLIQHCFVKLCHLPDLALHKPEDPHRPKMTNCRGTQKSISFQFGRKSGTTMNLYIIESRIFATFCPQLRKFPRAIMLCRSGERHPWYGYLLVACIEWNIEPYGFESFSIRIQKSEYFRIFRFELNLD